MHDILANFPNDLIPIISDYYAADFKPLSINTDALQGDVRGVG